jgi:hypothetical protein
MAKQIYDVFVSYRSVDRKVALLLADRLGRAGLRVWIDRKRILVGRFEEKLDRALERSKCVAVLVGPGGIGPWQMREMARTVEDERKLLVPVLLPGRAKAARLPLALAGLHQVDLTKGLDKNGVGRLIAAIGDRPRRRAPSGGHEGRVMLRTARRARAPRPLATTIGSRNKMATECSLAADTIIGSVISVCGGNRARSGRAGGR